MECEDLEHNCGPMVEDGQCEKNPMHMHQFCALSCNACGGNFPEQFADEDEDEIGDMHEEDDFDEDVDGKEQDEYGVVQVLEDDQHTKAILQAIEDMRVYFREARTDPATNSSMHTILDNCKNRHELCAFWKVVGECELVR